MKGGSRPTLSLAPAAPQAIALAPAAPQADALAPAAPAAPQADAPFGSPAALAPVALFGSPAALAPAAATPAEPLPRANCDDSTRNALSASC
jgi:hypothetical protein